MFKVNNKGNVKDVVLVPWLLTLNIFHTFLWHFYCWTWTSKCFLEYLLWDAAVLWFPLLHNFIQEGMNLDSAVWDNENLWHCSCLKLKLNVVSIYKKWSFSLRIAWVNVTKSAGNYGFGHIYWRNPQWKTSFFYSEN